MRGVTRLAATWLPPLAWMAIIFAFSAQHGGGDLSSGELVLRKLGHALGYLVLATLLIRALRRAGVAHAVVGGALAALAYAVSDEWHQSFVPGRTPAAHDVAIDGAGIAVAAIAVTRTRLRELAA